MSSLTDLQNQIVAGACGANDALAALDDQLGAMEDQINGALDDLNGAIGDIEGKLAEAQGALDAAIGDALAEVKTFQSEIADLLKDKLNPLISDSDIANKLKEIEEFYGDAIDDLDEVLGSIQQMLENPLGAAGDLCNLPNVEASADGPVAKAKEALVPAVDAVIEELKLESPTIASTRDTQIESNTVTEPTVVFPDARPATTGSGSVTVAHLTSDNYIPYVPERASRIYGLSVDQINANLQRLADDVMSPIKDEYPDLIITHGFRSEHVELRGGSYVTRRNPGSSHHYGGFAADFKFNGVTSKDELIIRANRIRQIVPAWTQFILEYPGRYQNSNFLLHIAYVPYDPRGQVITMLSNGTNVYSEFV